MLHRIPSGHNTRSSILGLLKINVNHCSSPGLTFRSALLGIGIAVTGGSGWKPRNADTRCVKATVTPKDEIWFRKRYDHVASTTAPAASTEYLNVVRVE